MVVDQTELLVEDTSTGAAWCVSHSALVDRWLAALFDEAEGGGGGVALVAIGDYGRSELCPQSDVDVMVVHGGRADIGAVTDRVWYPIWDKGLRLGHTVCTVREAVDAATETLGTATALLSARHVAGDPALTGRLVEAAQGLWQKQSKRFLADLGTRVDLRHQTAGVPQFPSAGQLEQLAVPGRHVDARNDVLTIVTDDRLGVFSRVAGVLALHGLDVVSASAFTSDDGRAISEFRVADPVRREIPWPRVLADIELGLDGRLAIPARLAERARTHARIKRSVAPRTAIKVTFDDDASADATVLDVQAPDAMGALYRITRVFGDLDVDIRSARVQTMGNSVVDSFYIRDRNGRRISDPSLRVEIERALIHSLSD